MDDASIIRRVMAGEVDAFRALVERYQGPLFSLVRNLVGDRQECEDIVQEVFMAAYAHLRGYDPGRSRFSTWLHALAHYRCINAWKKQRPRPTAQLPEEMDLRGPETALCEEEWYRQLDEGLAALPPEQKTVFVLAEIQELSHEEIAHLEGVAVGTVKSRLSRAKDKLRSFLRALERS